MENSLSCVSIQPHEAKVSGISNSLFGGLGSKVPRFPEPLTGKVGQKLPAWSFRTSSDLEMPWSTIDFITKSVGGVGC